MCTAERRTTSSSAFAVLSSALLRLLRLARALCLPLGIDFGAAAPSPASNDVWKPTTGTVCMLLSCQMRSRDNRMACAPCFENTSARPQVGFKHSPLRTYVNSLHNAHCLNERAMVLGAQRIISSTLEALHISKIIGRIDRQLLKHKWIRYYLSRCLTNNTRTSTATLSLIHPSSQALTHAPLQSITQVLTF